MNFLIGTKKTCDLFNKDRRTNYPIIEEIKDLPRFSKKRDVLVYIMHDAKEDLKIDVLHRRGIETIYINEFQ